MDLKGMVGRFQKLPNGTPVQFRLTDLGNQAVDLVKPERGELARANKRFCAVMGSGTFLAPVVAYPTTTLTMALYNPDTSGKAYYVDQAFEFLASGTPGAGGALLACVTDIAQARPTLSTGSNGGYAGTVISSLSGRGSPGNTQAVFINAITLTGSQPAWFVVQAEPAAGVGATIATHALVGDLKGGVLVPSGGMLGLTYLSGAGTAPLYGFGVIWNEMDADVE